MFQNISTSIAPLNNINENNCWENRPFTSAWPETVPERKYKEIHITKVTKKKNKRNRTAYTTDQLRALEKIYTKNKYINTERRKEIAKCLGVSEKCVKVWFQNRRMKEKRESSEASCDSSSERFVIEPITPPPQSNQNIKAEAIHQPQSNQNILEEPYTFPFHYNEEANNISVRQFYNNFVPEIKTI
ncbi:homeobox protein Hox-C6-like [Leptidea sinapis]|uniref:homeobox protein Hox-C6-like n=1 Tax=Leptidea sinapis TaxID=189913 RepID=UPI0021C4A9FB|nr:homeobox protein Hox-C6-like [Leptidea sinapis]